MTKKSPIKQPDDPIVKHARRELSMARMFEKTEDYDGSIGKGALALVKTFVKYTHGDADAAQAIFTAFNEVVRGQLLSAPTDNPVEWAEMKGADPMIWQNKRSPFYRSADNGKTWYHTQAKEDVHASTNHLTGEVPEDGTTNIQKDSDNGTDREGPQGSTESAGTDSTGESLPRQRVNERVVVESPQDTQESKDAPDEPAAGKDS